MEIPTPQKSLLQLIEDSPIPVLVDVYSDTCGPCLAMKPVLAELKQSLGDRLHILMIDGYANLKFMDDHDIRAFPTLLIFHQGKVVWTRAGYTAASMLEKMVRVHTLT
jgi:thioredoxin 1